MKNKLHVKELAVFILGLSNSLFFFDRIPIKTSREFREARCVIIILERTVSFKLGHSDSSDSEKQVLGSTWRYEGLYTLLAVALNAKQLQRSHRSAVQTGVGGIFQSCVFKIRRQQKS